MTPAQLEERRTGIGASDIAAVCGIDPWRTQTDVWIDKMGEGETPDNSAMEWGRRLEEPIAQKYAEETGSLVVMGGLVRHKELPWIIATPDRLVLDADGTPRLLLECKTQRNDEGWGRPGSEEIPEHYLCQVAWQQLASGIAVADVAVLIAAREFRVYHIGPMDALAAELRERGEEFWTQHVQTKIRPPFAGGPAEGKWLSSRYRKHSQELRYATPEIEQAFGEIQHAKESIEVWETEKAKWENVVKDYIGSAFGVEGQKGKATWGTTKGRVSWKAVADELKPSPGLCEKHRGEPYRCFRCSWES